LAEQLKTAEDWTTYLLLFQELHGRLKSTTWFNQEWTIECRHVPAGNRVIFILSKEKWCNRAIHFKTRLTNTDLAKGLVRVGLHVETNQSEHGINRIVFDKFFLEESGELIQSWPGYIIKPAHHQKPFYTWIEFTTETLVSGLEKEFARVRQLDLSIERAIAASRKGNG
jgi:hypothetical protein